MISKRDETIKKEKESISKLKTEIEVLNKKIDELKSDEIKRTSEIIRSAGKKSEKILNEQLAILKNEHEELTTSLRKRFKDEIASLDSTYKIQIDETVQSVFDKLFSKKEDNK